MVGVGSASSQIFVGEAGALTVLGSQNSDGNINIVVLGLEIQLLIIAAVGINHGLLVGIDPVHKVEVKGYGAQVGIDLLNLFLNVCTAVFGNSLTPVRIGGPLLEIGDEVLGIVQGDPVVTVVDGNGITRQGCKLAVHTVDHAGVQGEHHVGVIFAGVGVDVALQIGAGQFQILGAAPDVQLDGIRGDGSSGTGQKVHGSGGADRNFVLFIHGRRTEEAQIGLGAEITLHVHSKGNKIDIAVCFRALDVFQLESNTGVYFPIKLSKCRFTISQIICPQITVIIRKRMGAETELRTFATAVE